MRKRKSRWKTAPKLNAFTLSLTWCFDWTDFSRFWKIDFLREKNAIFRDSIFECLNDFLMQFSMQKRKPRPQITLAINQFIIRLLSYRDLFFSKRKNKNRFFREKKRIFRDSIFECLKHFLMQFSMRKRNSRSKITLKHDSLIVRLLLNRALFFFRDEKKSIFFVKKTHFLATRFLSI